MAGVTAILITTMVLASIYGVSPMIIKLERAGTHNGSDIRARDRERHARMGIIKFPLGGDIDNSSFGPLPYLYTARLKVGSPPQEFNLQMDSGSSVTWAGCYPCISCLGDPRMESNYFDPSRSSSASLISCKHDICNSGDISKTSCNQNSQCSYSMQYKDGDETSGYYVSDIFHFDTALNNTVGAKVAAPVIFGCSNNISASFSRFPNPIDGILGLGQDDMSVISQLSSHGIAPRAFSHCLTGTTNGGTLVFGEPLVPGIVYTPLVPAKNLYKVNLQTISVGGYPVNVDPEIFATSHSRGTIIDSGTTLAYLAEEAYDPFIDAILAAVRPRVTDTYIGDEQSQCFLVTESVSEVFPTIALHFEGGASLELKPMEYLRQEDQDAVSWCLGFLKNKGEGTTLLGDTVLKNKIVVYDLVRQRLGWVDYDCTKSFNISSIYSTSARMSTPSKYILPLVLLSYLAMVHH